MRWMDALPQLQDEDARRVRLASEVIGYEFADPRLARCALTSPGWLNEHQSRGWHSWKALEWQGDAVLYLVLTELMVSAGRAGRTGGVTQARDQLKSNVQLARVAGDTLWPLLFLGIGERSNNAYDGWVRFVSASVEALLGAVWFDELRRGTEPLPSARRTLGVLGLLTES